VYCQKQRYDKFPPVLLQWIEGKGERKSTKEKPNRMLSHRNYNKPKLCTFMCDTVRSIETVKSKSTDEKRQKENRKRNREGRKDAGRKGMYKRVSLEDN
jgi:hypothetical protein